MLYLLRQIQPPTNLPRPFIILPRAQPLFERALLLLVRAKRLLRLRNLVANLNLLLLQLGETLLIGRQSLQRHIQLPFLLQKLIDAPFPGCRRRQERFLLFQETATRLRERIAAREQKETAPHFVFRQETGALQVFEPHGKHFLIHPPIQPVPPRTAHVFVRHLARRRLQATFLLDAIHTPILSVRTGKAHISFAAAPFSARIAEKHIADETQHRRLAALIFAHHDDKPIRRRMPR